MTDIRARGDTPKIFLYFAPLTVLIYLVAPEYLLDIPTSYMLKNQLQASAPRSQCFGCSRHSVYRIRVRDGAGSLEPSGSA